jgi:hypothetical protein
MEVAEELVVLQAMGDTAFYQIGKERNRLINIPSVTLNAEWGPGGLPNVEIWANEFV